MEKATGKVIGIKTRSYLNKEKHLLEIELDKNEARLLNWQNKRVFLRKI